MKTESGPRRRVQHGLTLLEVLAAVALMGLVYTALASKATQGVMSESDSLRRFQASLLADGKLAEIETLAAMKQTPEVGRSEEESEDGVFLVETEVSSWTLPEQEQPETPADAARSRSESVLGGGQADQSALLQAWVRVSWRDGLGERSVERLTFLLDHGRILDLAPDDAGGETNP